MLSLRALLAAAVALLALLASPARAGLPSTITDLQRCQAYAQQLQAGQVPADACQPDTLATVSQRDFDEEAVSGGVFFWLWRRKAAHHHSLLLPLEKKTF